MKTGILLALAASTLSSFVGCGPPPLNGNLPNGRFGRQSTNAAQRGQQTSDGLTPNGDWPVAPLFQVLDTDHDLVLSSEEVANIPNRISLLDRNQDGVLTQDEIAGWLCAEQRSNTLSFPASWEEAR